MRKIKIMILLGLLLISTVACSSKNNQNEQSLEDTTSNPINEKKEREFLHYLGRRVEVKLYKPLGGKKEFDGILKKYENKLCYIETEGELLEVNPKDAAFIRLYFEF